MTIDFTSLDYVHQLRKAGLRPDERLAQKILTVGDQMVRPLIELACELKLFARPEPDCYAPIHALRLLGELRAPECVEPLLHTTFDEVPPAFQQSPIADIWFHEVPHVVARAAVDAPERLWAMADDAELPFDTRTGALYALEYITGLAPQQRAAIVAGFRERLSAVTPESDKEFTTQLITGLANLGVSEAYRDVMALYRAGLADTNIFSAAQARQLLLSKSEQRVEGVHLSLWDRYARFGPFPPEVYDEDAEWEDDE